MSFRRRQRRGNKATIILSMFENGSYVQVAKHFNSNDSFPWDNRNKFFHPAGPLGNGNNNNKNKGEQSKTLPQLCLIIVSYFNFFLSKMKSPILHTYIKILCIWQMSFIFSIGTPLGSLLIRNVLHCRQHRLQKQRQSWKTVHLALLLASFSSLY